MYRRNASTTTAVTVVPSARALSTAASHTSGGIRRERGIVAPTLRAMSRRLESVEDGVHERVSVAPEQLRVAVEGRVLRQRVRVGRPAPVALQRHPGLREPRACAALAGWARPTQAPPQPPKRPDLCPTLDHPGVTYNPWLGKTWCLCGAVIRDGNHVAEPHVACCGGPLSGEAS